MLVKEGKAAPPSRDVSQRGRGDAGGDAAAAVLQWKLQLQSRAPGDGAGRERTNCEPSSLYTGAGESGVEPPAGRPAGGTSDEACVVDLGGAGRVDAAERGCVGSKDAGDSPLACDAVQVVFVTWLGMAGHVGVGPAARIT